VWWHKLLRKLGPGQSGQKQTNKQQQKIKQKTVKTLPGKITKAKRLGTWLKCRAPAEQVRGPEFKPKYHDKKKLILSLLDINCFVLSKLALVHILFELRVSLCHVKSYVSYKWVTLTLLSPSQPTFILLQHVLGWSFGKERAHQACFHRVNMSLGKLWRTM
jgi:hypothetical protein